MVKRSDLPNLVIDNTLYYGDINGNAKGTKVKCKYCKQIHEYKAGEMVYKHNQYKFCSYECRSKWRKANPYAKPHNPFRITMIDVCDR